MADVDNKNLIDEEDEIIVLHNSETDKDEDFYHLATLDVDGKWYVVLQPVEKLDDIGEDEVLIYELDEDENGEDYFLPIDDDAVLDKVFNEFMTELEKMDNED